MVAGCGDFQCLSRPGDVTRPGCSPTPKVSSGGLDGGWSPSRVPVRGIGLRAGPWD
jgi:hypothetical protein